MSVCPQDLEIGVSRMLLIQFTLNQLVVFKGTYFVLNNVENGKYQSYAMPHFRISFYLLIFFTLGLKGSALQAYKVLEK